MDRIENGWMKGDPSVDQDDDIYQGKHTFLDLLQHFSSKDMTMISVVLGILSALIPWWTGISLLGCIQSTYWLFVFAGAFFIGGTVLNLRNPVGMVGQIIGIILFWVQMLAFYANRSGPFDPYLSESGIQLGVLFAVASVALCFMAQIFDAHEDRDIYQ